MNDGRIAGSPPRVRGKEVVFILPDGLPRITPARAGKRAGRWPNLSYIWDHPRACGEKVKQDVFYEIYPGSPPRVRGKGFNGAADDGYNGITPARAGKSLFPGQRYKLLQDHPRACGEKKVPPPFPVAVMGSPPRVRGKVSP